MGCALLLVGIDAVLLPVAAISLQSPTEVQAQRPESRRFLPLTNFYSTPSPFPPGRPGELIRSEEFDEYQLPEGVSAVRILYHSRSANGEDVAATGVVLTPDEKPPSEGWPVIAWAHGFTGIARQCSPSLMRNLNEGPFLSMYVKLGYAVVAPDYVGLGTKFRNASIDMQSNAADVIYSIPAARAAVPQLGHKWVALGESAGGLAALAVAELEHDIRDPDYLGSVAVSGVADAKGFFEEIAKGNSPGKFLFLAYAVQTLYPKFEANQILAEKGLAMYQELGSACEATSAGPEGVVSQLLKPDWEGNSFVRQFFERNIIGGKPAYGPLLIISSDSDPAARTGLTARAAEDLCKQHDLVEFHRYPGSEFAGVLGDSVRYQLTWIQARFAGRPAVSNCH